MKPSLAYFLVDIFSKPGSIVLDPFSGSGTIPLEAAMAGRSAVGMDISLLGTVLSNGKLMKADALRMERLIAELKEWITSRKPSEVTLRECKTINFNRELSEYFHEETLREILVARDFFADLDRTPEWYVALACMLHILHGNRPYALSRNSHPITPYVPTGPFVYKSVVEKLTDKVTRTLQIQHPKSFMPGVCFQSDILKPWPEEVCNVDTIITSPPFFDSTRFYMTNWMRYWFCGWSREDFSERPKEFVETLQKQSLNVYDAIFQHCGTRLQPGGIIVLHLGFSEKCNMGEELASIGERYFKVLDLFTETVEHCESHGIRDKGTVKGHQYLILRN